MDTFGKQDPFGQIIYDGEKIKTKVIDNGGKHAVWNEEFELENVRQQIRLNQSLVLGTYDKDMVTEDLLGSTNPLTFNSLCQDCEPKSFDLELFDDNYKHIGSAKFTTTYVIKPQDPLPDFIYPQCRLEISIVTIKLEKEGEI